jgi:hypothetical protein
MIEQLGIHRIDARDRIGKVSFQNVEWWLGIGFAGV